jgi:hypothetical protein
MLKRCVVSGRFVTTDVLYHGHFVTGRFVNQTFCSYGRFAAGLFVTGRSEATPFCHRTVCRGTEKSGFIFIRSRY